MAERKVLQKHYPPDYDWRKPLPTVSGYKNGSTNTIQVTWVLPWKIKCLSCSHYFSRGNKFHNTRKQVFAEKYLDKIEVVRLSLKCTNCHREMTFKTNPGTSDYLCERGAYRPYAPVASPSDANSNSPADTEEDRMVNIERRKRDAENEMAVADELEALQGSSARAELWRVKQGQERSPEARTDSRDMQLIADTQAAREAFRSAASQRLDAALTEERIPRNVDSSFLCRPKRKRDMSAELGMKR